MTLAICLKCGAHRVGAITPCAACGQASSGVFRIDVTFSDHRMSPSNLDEFGSVVRAIKDAAPDPVTARWAFLLHVSERYPELIGVSVDRSTLRGAATVLDSLALPTVELELRSPGDRLNERDVSPWGGLLLAALGLAVAWVGLRIETYSIPWYQDVRAILVVGLGFMLTGVGLQDLPGWLHGVFRRRAREHRPR